MASLLSVFIAPPSVDTMWQCFLGGPGTLLADRAPLWPGAYTFAGGDQCNATHWSFVQVLLRCSAAGR